MSAQTTDLPQRRATILRVIVAEHIASAVPVPSESIARGYSLGISPATIRHEMARLEEEGYINRPHTSAGGVPTDRAYRYYVECLVQESKIGRKDQMAIRRFFEESEQEPEAWARLAVSILTERLESIAVATVPRAAVCRFRHVDLVALQELLILLVLVLQEGMVRKRILALSQAMSQDELTASANKMNASYQGLSCRQIGASDVDLSPVEQGIKHTVMGMMQTEERQQNEQFYLDGLRYLISQAESIRERSLLSLVEAIEERTLLSNLLRSLGDISGTRVTIGNENREEALQGCSVILSNYGVDERRGAVGVIGPTRMPYGRVIPTVDFISSVLSDMFGRIYT